MNLEPSELYSTDFTLLYVEDNSSNVQLIEQVLRKRPRIRLLVASDGGLGAEMAKVHRPDLILLDIHLPVMNGLQVLKKLKTMAETRSIPVIGLSADGMHSDTHKILKLGFHSFITKPLDVSKFLDTLDKILI